MGNNIVLITMEKGHYMPPPGGAYGRPGPPDPRAYHS